MMTLTFEKYAASWEIRCDFGILDLSQKNNGYCIFEGDHPLLTPDRNLFFHTSGYLVRLIVTDLQLHRATKKKGLSPALIWSFYRDILSAGEDPYLQHWQTLEEQDILIRMKRPEKPNFRPFGPEESLFSFSFICLSALTESVNRFAGRIMGEISLDEQEAHPFSGLIRHFYMSLPGEQRAVVQALSSRHQAGIVMPLLFVSGDINSVEYAQALLSLRLQPRERFSELLAELAGLTAYLDCLTVHRRQEIQPEELIKDGEGDALEFKSTLRWDIRAGKTNPAIEHACLKTIAAFLNSNGGTLLIGVRDDGSIEGIETDKFANEDKFLLHLWTLIRSCLGRDFTPYIRTRLEKTNQKTICIVTCNPAARPVFLRQPAFGEEMYIRLGPSSNAMNISEAISYVKDHFKHA